MDVLCESVMNLALALLVPAIAFAQETDFTAPAVAPITAAERLQWVVQSTVLPSNILANAIAAGVGTGLDHPTELGTHWTGFQKRYVNTMATSLLGNGIEAGLGAAWGEDPRYQPAEPGTSFSGRLMHAAKWTVLARNRDGEMRPAYARFIAIPAAAGISNVWRPDSETGVDNFAERTAFGFAGHFGGNAWNEFWPDVKKRMLRKGGPNSSPFKGL
jgi:hypothetical protein